MISYEKACDIVFSASKFGICLGLERMELLVAYLGSPEKQIPAIHLAGTNGKGSTLTYLKSIFIEAGLNVGTFTSPAIQKINDKIQVNNQEISDLDFAEAIAQILPAIEQVKKSSYGPPTEFEIMTALAFQYFAVKAKPDILLIETGLGGRLDSTNVIQPIISIITNIGHDHMDILGNTIEAVAKEKAGIIKPFIPVVSGCKQKEAIEVIKEQASKLSAKLYQLQEDFWTDRKEQLFSFSWNGQTFSDLKTGMIGKHQQENASVAVMTIQALKEYSISETAIRNGLRKAKISNRIEVVQEQPTIILDGGHNPEGVEALANTLTEQYPSKKISVLFCAMKDKQINEMLAPIRSVAHQIILTSFPFERVMDPNQVEKLAYLENVIVIENCVDAYHYLLEKSGQNDCIVVTGSLYFLTYFRNQLKL